MSTASLLSLRAFLGDHAGPNLQDIPVPLVFHRIFRLFAIVVI